MSSTRFGGHRVRSARPGTRVSSRRLRLEHLEDRCVLGGSGSDLLLVVNPGDENALRIANAYQELRGIPDNNFVFITPPASNGAFQSAINSTTLKDAFVTPIANAIAARGLTDQIDYISTLGQPSRYSITGDSNSFTYAMMILDAINNGVSVDNADHVVTGLYDSTPDSVPIGDNPAIHHSTHYTIDYGSTYDVDTQYYMAGALAYTWIRGNSADEVIANLQRNVAADGTHPSGTVYFMDNDDIRSGRRYQWGKSIQVVGGNGSPSYGGDGQQATLAALNAPQAIDVDGSGNIFVTDTGNHRIRRIVPAGTINTVAGNGTAGFSGDAGYAGSAQISSPGGIVADSAGNYYIADTANHRIRKVTGSTITTIAGNGSAGFAGDNGPAASARLSSPRGLALDAAGNLYIADTGNNRVRRINLATGTITTVAGTGTSGFNGDGIAATAARLAGPRGVALDSADNLYIADTSNYRVRKVEAATGLISTVAGTGTSGYNGDGISATAAAVTDVGGVTVDLAGDLFIADTSNHRIRKVDSATGLIETLAGTGTPGFGGDGGPGTAALLKSPAGVAVDAAGNLLIADTGNYHLRKLNVSTGLISNIAGNEVLGDGGSATSASLALPQAIALAGTGGSTILIADSAINRIRKISGGTITTVAGNGTAGYGGDGGPATAAVLNNPSGIAADSAGTFYISDTGNNRIRKVDPSTGLISTVAGNGTGGYGGDGGAATAASLNAPRNIALDAAGNLYIADTANHRIRRLDAASGNITTVAGNGTAGFAGDGGPATAASLGSPSGIAVDAAGNLYIGDTANNRVRKVDAATGLITTVAGNGTAAYAGENGPATAASLNGPTGVAIDSAGNLYISDSGNRRVRKVNPAGVITVQAGTGSLSTVSPGNLATATPLNNPGGLAVDPTGALFIADRNNFRIRKVLNDPKAQENLTARGIPWVYEYNTAGQTPRNRTDVLGAVIGNAGYQAPNGSTYVAGSWADNLTSYGCTWDDRGQTKDSRLISSGVAATTGSVIEPYLNYYRFTNASVYLYQHDGSTMGEAFARTVATPDIQLFLGDLLAQPGADVPRITLTDAPAEGATVSGTIGLSASAWLEAPQIATGVERLELLVDGRPQGRADGASTTFALDTATLSDGRHELRIVATNNAAAESEGMLVRNVVVNNHGQSVAVLGGDRQITGTGFVAFEVQAEAAAATIARIELRHLGRPMGQVDQSSGTIYVDSSQLAYGSNKLTPVAIFTDGTEVAGVPVNLRRDPIFLPGMPQTAAAYRTAGLKGEYFLGQGAASIGTSDFSGTPDVVGKHIRLNLNNPAGTTGLDQTLSPLATTAIADLAVRFSGRFYVPEDKAGEYQFYFWRSNDSLEVLVDGQRAVGIDGAQGGITTNQVTGLFLAAGEHELTVRAANTVTATRGDSFDISVEYRGPDGVTRVIDNNSFYQVRPVVTSAGVSVSGATGSGGTYRVGDVVTATWDNTATGDNNDTRPLSSVTFDFSEFGGPASVTAVNTANRWVASYQISRGAIFGTRNVWISVTDTGANTTAIRDDGNVTVDNIVPFPDILDVSPDPRSDSVAQLTIRFNEPIVGLQREHLVLTRSGGGNLLTGAEPFSSVDGGQTWVLSGLAGLTSAEGSYLLQLNAIGAGLVDLAGNPVTEDAAETWLLAFGSLEGTHWNDLDADGIWDAGEPPLSDWQVYLDTNQNGSYEDGEPTTTTAGDGSYTLSHLPVGPRSVVESLAPGWQQTTRGNLDFSSSAFDGRAGIDGLAATRYSIVSPDGTSVYATGYSDAALAVFQRNQLTGVLTFVEFKKDSVGGVDGLAGATGLAISPDGRHVYATGYTDNAVAVFRRDLTSGALTFVEFKRDGVGGIDGLYRAGGVTVSPDGHHVYVTGVQDDAVAVFSRDPLTGALTFVEVQKDGVGGVDGLDGAWSAVCSPDGAYVYVTAYAEHAVAVFLRNPSTGRLTFVEAKKDGLDGVDGLRGARHLVLAPDGAFVYVTGADDDAVAAFSRDPATGRLTFIQTVTDGVGGFDGLDGATGLAISPNGNYLYVASQLDDAVAVLARDASAGTLRFVEVLRDGVGGIDGLDGAYGLAISPNGANVYVNGASDSALATLSRQGGPGQIVEVPANGMLAGVRFGNYINLAPLGQDDGYSTTVGTTCVVAAPGVLANDQDPNGHSIHAVKLSDPAHGSLVLALDGSFTYVPQPGYRGDDSFTYAASDGGLQSGASTVVLHVTGAAIVGRWLFYNNSYFDGRNAAANAVDDAAIATDKQALAHGATAAFVNYSSYNKGMNGIMIDIAGLPDTPSAADFEFRYGNTNTPSAWLLWAAAPAITVRPGAGVGNSDRVTLIWPDYDPLNPGNPNAARVKTWLQVNVLPSVRTGLAAVDTFYFGNAIGESGNSTTNAYVEGFDFAGARDNPHSFTNRATITDVYDFNRDSLVNGFDLSAVRDNNTNFLTALKLITPSGATGSSASSSSGGTTNAAVLATNAVILDSAWSVGRAEDWLFALADDRSRTGRAGARGVVVSRAK